MKPIPSLTLFAVAALWPVTLVAQPGPTSQSEQQLESAFEQLRQQGEDLAVSVASVIILGRTDTRYQLLAQLLAGQRIDPAQKASLAKGNPFYEDSAPRYREFIASLRSAKAKEPLNGELESLLAVAEWRLARLAAGGPPVASPQDELTAFPAKLEAAKSEPALRELITAYRKFNVVANARARLAQLLVQRVDQNKLLPKLAIEGIASEPAAPAGFVTIRTMSAGGSVVLVDHPQGEGVGMVGVTALPRGVGSTYCFKGPFTWRVGTDAYDFKGSEEDPLIFALLARRGFVYLMGTGEVTMPGGKVVKLGGPGF